MRVITMYLPQYHRVKENDEWWGEGFTDWEAAKIGKPLFDGHYQPRVPLDNNYYDLMDKSVMKWQADLMKKYGIDGQCFYHYWFENGRKILEKPAENLLKWKDIDMNFCFSWANMSWIRSWSNVEGEIWTSSFENEKRKKGNGCLLKQSYGKKKDWEEHFDYLLPFFKDERYIKIEGKPVLMIYEPRIISCIEEMFSCFNELAKTSGLNGIYTIGRKGISPELLHVLDKEIVMPPTDILSQINYDLKNCQMYNYDDMWGKIINNVPGNDKTIFGGIVGYDDTPRHGKSGTVLFGEDPDKFRDYLKKLFAKNDYLGNEVTFINAWNEWGEGNYLEPDKKYEYKFLEAIKQAKADYKDVDCTDFESVNNDTVKDLYAQLENERIKSERYRSYWIILNEWLNAKEEGRSLEDYFLKQNIKNIGVYGAGMLGKHLYSELKGSRISINYYIDVKGDSIKMDCPVYSIEEDFPEVDAIVVSATFDYKSVKNKLMEKGVGKIISLEEVFFE